MRTSTETFNYTKYKCNYMTKVVIKNWVDGDSGEVILDGKLTRVRLSGVHAADRYEAGYGASTVRTRRMLPEGEEVEVKFVGTDTYGRRIVEIAKNGRCVNEILERTNRLFK
jgi:endonuclease YncB( thermonuclease family)